jgi:hypothetical protein
MDDLEFLDTDQEQGDPNPDPPAPAANAPKDKGGDKDDDIRQELKSLRARVSEAENDARYWREQAKTPAPKDDAPAEDDDDVDLEGVDLVDVISSGDPKKVKETFKKLGFVSEKDVQKRIQETRQEIAQNAKITDEYPDLADPSSEFFKAADAEYRDLIADDPSLKDKPSTIRLAAKLAAAKQGGGSRGGDDDRAERIARQSGDRSRKQGRGQSADNRQDGPQQLSKTQKTIVQRLQDAGADIDEEKYTARAQKGVRMGLRNAMGATRRAA